MADDDRTGHPPAGLAPAPPAVSGRRQQEGGPGGTDRLPPAVSGTAAHEPTHAEGEGEPTPAPETPVGGIRVPPVVAPADHDDEAEEEGSAFPMDAFFIPEDTDRVPMGMDPAGPRGGRRRAAAPDPHQALAVYGADDVAQRLEELAARLRDRGTATAVGWAEDRDPLRRALGQALARFLPPDAS